MGVERTVVESVYVHPVEPVVVVSVRPDRRWERRPRCGVCRRRAPLYDRGGRRRWRSLDAGLLRVYLEADLPRVECREHRVVMAAVPWARHGAGHTVAFDETVAWFAAGASKTLIATLLRINWHTVGSIPGADWISRVVATRAANAVLCLDPFHVVKWAGDALDIVRRQVWNTARRAGMKTVAAQLKDSRYALWKNPQDLTEKQQAKLSMIQSTNKPLYRAYLLKEQLRAVFAPGGPERVLLLDKWLAWASRSKLKPFVDLARTIRVRRPDIANVLTFKLTNARIESMNTKIRLIIRRAYGFRSVNALKAMIQLCLAGYARPLPGRT